MQERDRQLCSGLVDILRVSIIKIILALVRVISGDWGRNVLDTDLRLMFVKSGYLMRGHFPTIRDVDLKKNS